MDKDKLLELAGRCEAATGPDGMLDRDIRAARIVPETRALRRYTASLDAAMTLVPEGLFPTIDFVAIRCWLRTAQGFDVDGGPAYGCGGSVPLALCAAALRARANAPELGKTVS